MNVYDILEALGIEDFSNTSEEQELLLETEIEVHQQPNYPLKGRLVNVCVKDGVIRFASSSASEYGDKEAWGDGCF